eukprot:scaffold39174_cov30-Prasinocladus_malaysianus.AAC.1
MTRRTSLLAGLLVSTGESPCHTYPEFTGNLSGLNAMVYLLPGSVGLTQCWLDIIFAVQCR